jgi:hypothetical protein
VAQKTSTVKMGQNILSQPTAQKGVFLNVPQTKGHLFLYSLRSMWYILLFYSVPSTATTTTILYPYHCLQQMW